MAKSHGGYSRSAQKRRERAAMLSQQMRHGDGDAAFRLLQRRRALSGIKKRGWSSQVRTMNETRRDKREQRLHALAVAGEQQRQAAQSTFKLDARGLAAYRARFGQGGFSADYAEGACHPAIPGVPCPACGWQWGDREPHLIAVP